MVDEWQQARDELVRAGVEGAEDLGRFVNDGRYLRPTRFDERAAMPVLLELLPRLVRSASSARPTGRPSAMAT